MLVFLASLCLASSPAPANAPTAMPWPERNELVALGYLWDERAICPGWSPLPIVFGAPEHSNPALHYGVWVRIGEEVTIGIFGTRQGWDWELDGQRFSWVAAGDPFDGECPELARAVLWSLAPGEGDSRMAGHSLQTLAAAGGSLRWLRPDLGLVLCDPPLGKERLVRVRGARWTWLDADLRPARFRGEMDAVLAAQAQDLIREVCSSLAK